MLASPPSTYDQLINSSADRQGFDTYSPAKGVAASTMKASVDRCLSNLPENNIHTKHKLKPINA